MLLFKALHVASACLSVAQHLAAIVISKERLLTMRYTRQFPSLRNCDPYCALSSKCFFKAGLHDLSRVCKAAKIRLVPHSAKMVSRIASFSSALDV